MNGKTLENLVNEIADDVRFHCKNCNITYSMDVSELVAKEVSDYFDESMDYVPSPKWYGKAYTKIYNSVCDLIESNDFDYEQEV